MKSYAHPFDFFFDLDVPALTRDRALAVLVAEHDKEAAAEGEWDNYEPDSSDGNPCDFDISDGDR